MVEITLAGEKVKVPVKVYKKIASSAKRGAKFLDKHDPQWFLKIEVDDLNMQDHCRCVYGQLHMTGLLNHIDRYKYENGNTPDGQFGYIPPDNINDWIVQGKYWDDGAFLRRLAAYAVLQEEWLREIYLRRGQ